MKKQRNALNPKEVDCIIIAMLEEEKDLFWACSDHLIKTNAGVDKNISYIEFIFFDKLGYQRTGVICSSSTGDMGNTAACSLYYSLSRKYRSGLYINIGVAGYVKDVRIGDVVIVNRITTMGENNASNEKWQQRDAPVCPEIAAIASSLREEFGNQFKKRSQLRLSEFQAELKNHACPDEKIKSFLGSRRINSIRMGGCLTVPEVIKTGIPGESQASQTDQVFSRFQIPRKYMLLDMEAYYFAVWHSLVKQWDAGSSVGSSIFLSIKSVSDMADDDKELVEECGSRSLAMGNLTDVTCAYLTDIHTFSRLTDLTLYSYFQSEVSKSSLDPLLSSGQSEDTSVSFSTLCNHFILPPSNSVFSKQTNCIDEACNFLSAPSNSLWLHGRAGTGKSTFLSYVYDSIIAQNKRAILIDFSKFSSKTSPTDDQVIYLLKHLLPQESNLIVFIDGISPYYTNYEVLLDVMQSAEYSNLSLCVSDISYNDDNNEQSMGRNPADFLPSKSTVVCCTFSGVSLASSDLKEVLNCAQIYFESIGKKFDVKSILNFIEKSKLRYLDFRLLKMFAEYPFNTAKNLFDFVDYCCSRKSQRRIYTKLYSHNPFTLAKNTDVDPDVKKAYLSLSKNSYMRAFLFANCVFHHLTSNGTEALNEFLGSDYVLSDDMNLFLSYLVNRPQNAEAFAKKVISLFSDSTTICCSAETQLMYSLFQIENLNRVQDTKRKEIIRQKASHALEQFYQHRNQDEVYLDWLLQYRTFSIVLAQYCSEPDMLKEYNKLLLSESDVEQNNLAFHLLYYSRQEFTFKQVHTLDLENISPEMFYGTYYVLLSSLDVTDPKEDVAKRLIARDTFTYMNLITFAQLTKKYMVDLGLFLNLSSSAKDTLQKAENVMKGLDRVQTSESFPLKGIRDLAQNVLHQLKTNH